MKISLLIFSLVCITCIGCSVKSDLANQHETENMKPVTTLEEANTYVQEHFKDPVEIIWIANSLLDPSGFNMAIIADGIIRLGYMPDGFEQKAGYRIYTCKKDE